MGWHSPFGCLGDDALRSTPVGHVVAVSLGESISSLSQGDLTHQMTGSYGGDLQVTVGSFNTGLSRLRSALIDVEDLTGQVHQEMGPIKEGAKVLSERAADQLRLLEESSSSMHSISDAITEVATETSDLTQTSVGAADSAGHTKQVISQAVEAMTKIETSSVRVSEIIGVIDSIAFQTNLLALNAAVEAARAGDAGRGFEVVASEVRSLATRSSDAANEVRTIIDEISREITDGVRLAVTSSEVITEIDGEIRYLADRLGKSSTAQANLSQQIKDGSHVLTSVKDLTDLNARLADQNSSSAKALEAAETDLLSKIQVFKTRSGDEFNGEYPELKSTG